MKIRTTGHEQSERASHPAIALLRLRVMIGVARFEGVEARGGQGWNDRVATSQAGMCEGSQAAGRMDDRDDLRRWATAPRDERRSPEFEVAIERLVARGDMAGCEQRRRDLRPADAAAARGLGQDGRDVDRRSD